MTGRHAARGRRRPRLPQPTSPARRHSTRPPRRRAARSLAVASASAVLLALWTASLAPEPAPPPTPSTPGVVWLPPRFPGLRIPALAPALAAASEPSDDVDLPTAAEFSAASSRAVRVVADGLGDPPPSAPMPTPAPTSATSSQPTTTTEETTSGRREVSRPCGTGS